MLATDPPKLRAALEEFHGRLTETLAKIEAMR